MFKKTESDFHKFLKEIVAKEFENKDFTILQEPIESPDSQLWWHSYRPDVLAIKSNEKQKQVILVEIETKPSKRRLLKKMNKIRKNLSLQKQLHQKTKFLPLLVIPPFNLSKIFCSDVRRFWEIWIINSLGNIKHRISTTQ